MYCILWYTVIITVISFIFVMHFRDFMRDSFIQPFHLLLSLTFHDSILSQFKSILLINATLSMSSRFYQHYSQGGLRTQMKKKYFEECIFLPENKIG